MENEVQHKNVNWFKNYKSGINEQFESLGHCVKCAVLFLLNPHMVGNGGWVMKWIEL